MFCFLCFMFCVLYFMFYVLCFVFYVLWFMFCVLCFVFCDLCFMFYRHGVIIGVSMVLYFLRWWVVGGWWWLRASLVFSLGPSWTIVVLLFQLMCTKSGYWETKPNQLNKNEELIHVTLKRKRSVSDNCDKKQAGAVLGQAQLQPGLICTNMISKKYLAWSLVSLCSLCIPTWPYLVRGGAEIPALSFCGLTSDYCRTTIPKALGALNQRFW